MRLMNKVLVFLILLTVLLPLIVFSQQKALNSQTETVLSSEKPTHQLFVRNEIKQLLALDAGELVGAQRALLNLDSYNTSFNAAENFLFMQLKAQQALNSNFPQRALEFIATGDTFLDKISEQQQASRQFAKSWLVKSKAHESLEQYQEAFDSKHSFLKKYSNSFTVERQQEIAELNKKYEITKKEKANELLESQNELTHLKIAEVDKERAAYERNKGILLLVTLTFIIMLSRQITVSRRLKRMSKRDHLTGIYNRRTLFERGQQLMASYIKSGETFCVILFDVDHFKEINDTCGHLEGDKVLKQITKVARQALRSRDIFARIGGEEFVVLLPEATLEETKAIAEHMRVKIQNHLFSCFQNTSLQRTENIFEKNNITASFGVTCSGFVEPDFDHLIHIADRSMYQAKVSGRNTVNSYAGANDNQNDS